MADISKIKFKDATYDVKDTQARTDVANSFKEAYLTWGGKNLSGGYAPIDSAMNPVLSANRLAGFKPAGTTIEYSTDNGSTWNTYTTTDGGKTALFTTQATYYLGGPSAKAGSTTANNKLRITIDGIDGQVYTQLNKIHMYVSTNGSAGSTVTVESSPYSNPTVFSTVASNVPLSGWSGWNVINFTLPGTGAFGGSNSSTHQRKIRFTFSNTGCTSTYSGLQIIKIYGYGGVGWTTPSTIAANGVPYTYDYAGNVTIPASLTVSGTINGTVTNATKATQDSLGQTITSTYIKSIGASGTTITFTKGDGTSGSFTTQDTKDTAGAANTTSKIYLVGPTTQTDYAKTYSNSNVYATNGALYATSFNGKIGTSTIGSTTKGIYLNAGTPTPMTYELKSTLNSGTSSALAYYSGANAVSSLPYTTSAYVSGTTSTVGYVNLKLGNQIRSGTTNNAHGVLTLFNDDAGGIMIQAHNGSGIGVCRLPSGTVYAMSTEQISGDNYRLILQS